MKSALLTASVATMVFCAGASAEEKRAADAHQHGHGALNVALEGDMLGIELETPGADILGFEHMAEADEDKAAVEKAREILGDPVALFGVAAAAKCSVAEAEIEIGADGDEHHDDHGDEHDDHGDEDHAEEGHDDHGDEDHAEEGHDDHGDEDHAEEGHDDHGDEDHAEHDHDDHGDEGDTHSEVHAHYTLTCAAPGEIAELDLSAFFAAFPNAEELDAAVLTDNGQASGELTAEAPTLTF